MARQDGRDPPKGRMLFTDFDASLMGRPPTASIPSASSAPAILPSLEDVISRIDIAFEDDDDPAAEDGFDPAVLLARERRRRGDDAGRRRATASANDSPEDDEDDGEDANASVSEADLPDFGMGYGGSSRSPAFRSRDMRVMREYLDGEEGDSAFRDDLGEDDSFQDFGTGGSEWDAAFTGEPTGGGDDLDILALLPPVSIPGRRARKRRREASPPERPYGGIERVKDWFQPPERSERGDPAIEPGDWYEPPESPGTSGRRAGNKPSSKPSASQRRSAEDLFSDVDLNQAWQKRAGVSGKGATPVENRDDAEDLFAELTRAVENDAESPAPGGPHDKRDGTALGSGDSTIIVSPHQLEKRDFDKFGGGESTVIVSREMLDDTAEPHPRHSANRPAPDSKRPEPDEAPSRAAAEDDSVPVLEMLDDFAALPDAGGAERLEDADGGTSSPPAMASTAEAVETDTVDFADFPDLADSPAVDVAAPVLSDDDLVADADSASDGSGVRENEGAADADSVPVEPDPRPDESLGDPEFEIEDYIPGGVEDAGSDVAAPVLSDDDLIDYSSSAKKKRSADADDDEPGAEGGGAPEGEGEGGEGGGEPAVAVDPLDVFANLDSLDDFDDGGLDDEMQAMLAEDADADGEADTAGADAGAGSAGVAEEAPPPPGWRGVVYRIAKKAGGIVGKVVPLGFVHRVLATLAFRENWRFYCDLIAALIATASLAVIVSYLLWFR